MTVRGASGIGAGGMAAGKGSGSNSVSGVNDFTGAAACFGCADLRAVCGVVRAGACFFLPPVAVVMITNTSPNAATPPPV